MWRYALCLGLGTALAGCGDPLKDVTRLADVELADEQSAAQITAPTEAEDTRPIFARIFSKPEPEAPTQVAAEPAQPLEDVAAAPETDGDQEAAPQAPTDEMAAAQEADADVIAEKRPAAAAEEENQVQVNQAGAGGLLGLFSRLGSNRAEPKAEALKVEDMAEPEKIAPEEEEAVVQASAAPVTEQADAQSPLRGLFSSRKAERLTGPDAQNVAPGTPVPFGAIVRVCDLRRSDLGKEVERSGGGKGKYRLYDSIPNSTAMRPFYITGFDDGCPRKVSAALALFASASHYETLRTSGAAKNMSTGAADKAYEKARRQTCRAKMGKDCGAKAAKLEKETAFLTVYDRFGSSQNWRDILLHDGVVLAMD